jgi:hypothetical protein
MIGEKAVPAILVEAPRKIDVLDGSGGADYWGCTVHSRFVVILNPKDLLDT